MPFVSKLCKNCGSELTGLYCSTCGQKSDIHRITFGYVLHDIAHFFTHLEKGFLFTTWNLIKVPGKSVLEFIEGSRKKYQSPISYFLIWITIYFLFLLGLETIFGENVVINYKQYFGPEATTRFAIRHLSLVLTAVIPFQALILKYLIAGKRINYAESLVAVVYVLGTIIVYQFLFAILSLLYYFTTGRATDLRISDLLKVFFLIWFIRDFMNEIHAKNKLIKGALFILLAFGVFTVWRFYGFPQIMELFH